MHFFLDKPTSITNPIIPSLPYGFPILFTKTTTTTIFIITHAFSVIAGCTTNPYNNIAFFFCTGTYP